MRSPCHCLCRPLGTDNLLAKRRRATYGGTRRWRKPQQTAETFADGWLHSGDIARVDDEGLVYIVDRIKDMINRGGENVYSIEVENALGAHLAVAEVAVWVSPIR